MLHIQVFDIDRRLVWKGMEYALERGPMLVAVDPMLEDTGLHFFEFEAGIGVKGEPEPVFPLNHKVADKQAFCCTCQI